MRFKEDTYTAVPLWSQYRDQFPVTERLIYLNHAAVAPLCRAASDAMKRLADDVCLYGSYHYSDWLGAYQGLRVASARLPAMVTPGSIAVGKRPLPRN